MLVDQTRDDGAATTTSHADGRQRIAEEVRLLLEALSLRAEEFLSALGGLGSHVAGPSGHRAACDGDSCDETQQTRGAHECLCPVCVLASVVKGEHAELTRNLSEHFAEQLASLISVLRRALRDWQHDGAAGNRGGSGAESPEHPSAHEPGVPAEVDAAASPVQRIAVRRVRGNVGDHRAAAPLADGA